MRNDQLGIRWVVILGLVGFLVGFIGPMILSPESNQGPLLGIFITGPIGVLGGLILWGVSKSLGWTLRTQFLALYSGCALLALSVVAVALAPKPNWIGRLYTLEIKSCRQAESDIDDAIERWTTRISSFAWKVPRQNWKEDLRRTLLADPGSIVEARILTEQLVRETKPLFGDRAFEAAKLTARESLTRSFYVLAPCSAVSLDAPTHFFVDLGVPRSLTPTKKGPWPPLGVADLLMLATLTEVPSELKRFIE